MLALERLRQEDDNFGALLSYMAKPLIQREREKEKD